MSFTQMGEELRPIIRAMADWGVRHAGGRMPPPLTQASTASAAPAPRRNQLVARARDHVQERANQHDRNGRPNPEIQVWTTGTEPPGEHRRYRDRHQRRNKRHGRDHQPDEGARASCQRLDIPPHAIEVRRDQLLAVLVEREGRDVFKKACERRDEGPRVIAQQDRREPKDRHRRRGENPPDAVHHQEMRGRLRGSVRSRHRRAGRR